jgi:hypothetical protein
MERQVKSLLRAKNNPYSFSGKGVALFVKLVYVLISNFNVIHSTDTILLRQAANDFQNFI